MSRPAIGVAVVTIFTLATVFVPNVPDKVRWITFSVLCALLVILCIWWWFAPASQKMAKGTPATSVSAQRTSGNVIGAGRDVHQIIYHTPVTPPPDEPNPFFVAMDELKALREQGEKLIRRFYEDGVIPIHAEIQEYGEQTLAVARRRIFEGEINAKLIARFQQPWDEMEVLREKAKLVDSGRIKNQTLGELLSDSQHHPTDFDQLYSRCMRLHQLISTIEGTEGRKAYRPWWPPRGPADRAVGEYTRDVDELAEVVSLKIKLAGLIEKRGRLAATASSPGHNIAEATGRNEQFIKEVEAEIKRIEEEE